VCIVLYEWHVTDSYNIVFPFEARLLGSIALDTMVPTVPDTFQRQGIALLLTFSDFDIICTMRLHSVGNQHQ